jgi:peptide/nickel transport system permease protein
MVSFILRRIAVSVLVLLAASFIMYTLTAISDNPLKDLLGSSSPNRDQLIQARVDALDLDVPPPLRWFLWLGGAAGCLIPFADSCDLGVTISNAPVTTLLPNAMISTIQLVSISVILAIFLGILVGIVTALRQYSGFDYTMTFVSFFLYSLPAFLVAVMLKEFVAIDFNDFLQADSALSAFTIVVVAILVGLLWQVLVAGDLRRRLTVFLVSAAATGAVLAYISATDWFRRPSLGPVVLTLLIAGIVYGTTFLVAGPRNRKALYSGIIAGAASLVGYFTLQGLFDISTAGTMLILLLVAVVIGLLAGYLLGGPDRAQSMRVGAIVGLASFALVIVDRFMQSWYAYSNLARINGRPIATVGSSTPGLDADLWIGGLDTFTHFLLPTISLLLISFAGYTRYARAGMLEVLGQDYIRTARAKGLPERTVIVRHAFRNMLIPIATLVASDVGALLGGAIITERVFGISGMGALFSASLERVDLNPVMGYFIVIAGMAIFFNILADLAYSALDPRVRVR